MLEGRIEGANALHQVFQDAALCRAAFLVRKAVVRISLAAEVSPFCNGDKGWFIFKSDPELPLRRQAICKREGLRSWRLAGDVRQLLQDWLVRTDGIAIRMFAPGKPNFVINGENHPACPGRSYTAACSIQAGSRSVGAFQNDVDSPREADAVQTIDRRGGAADALVLCRIAGEMDTRQMMDMAMPIPVAARVVDVAISPDHRDDA